MLLRPVRRIAAALSANRNSSARPTTEFRRAPRLAVEVVIRAACVGACAQGSSLSQPRGARARIHKAPEWPRKEITWPISRRWTIACCWPQSSKGAPRSSLCASKCRRTVLGGKARLTLFVLRACAMENMIPSRAAQS